ncbi:MAG: type II toxin-antitoxin system VapC family toxin [Lachnospiraceae bacterium]|nr:type II toxin-antitoxin system VapC family toxin [Lachnospiraceae bacterium]
MKYLLDTHVLLWALKGVNSNGEEFTGQIKGILLDRQNIIFYSSVNIFEIEIKRIVRPQDNLPSGEEVMSFCAEAGFAPLSLRCNHTLLMKTLQRSESVKDHKDPYDWLLISQAKSEGMIFITHDSKIKQYKDKCILGF